METFFEPTVAFEDFDHAHDGGVLDPVIYLAATEGMHFRASGAVNFDIWVDGL